MLGVKTRSFWIKWNSNPVADVLIKRENRVTQGRRLSEDRGRDWSNTSTSRGTPRLEEAGRIPRSLQRERGPADPLISDFLSPEP